MQQLNSYQKRQKEFEGYDVHEAYLPLSSYLFIEYGNELLSYYGGNMKDYFVFGGATLINCEMMAYAKQKEIPYFNFGGTIETSQSKDGQGNFNYKKQFGGELVQYCGSFTKPLTLFGKIMTLKEKRN